MKSSSGMPLLFDPTGVVKADKTPLERADLLDKIRWMDSFDWKQVESLAKYVQMYKAIEKTVLFQEGNRQAFMALIVAGKIEIIRNDSRGKQHQVAVLGRGQALGEMSLIDHEPRSATAITCTDTVMMVLTEEDFTRLRHEHPQLALKLIMKISYHMSQRLRHTSGQLVDALESKPSE